MRRTSSCLFFILFICSSFIAVQAQDIPVTIRVVAHQSGLPFATISVVSLPDSLVKKSSLTDSSGMAMFYLKAGQPWQVRISSVNYLPAEKTILPKGDSASFIITLTETTNTLQGVSVTASRPLMRQEDDKTIVDPEALAAVSTNAYEIMEKTPGLFVDQDGNVYLSSTTPATIYINGREQKMSAADMATLLKNLPPNAIASIEIMRTPSSRYDASGSGGIVNIILKKGVRIGLTGSISAGIHQGRYGTRFTGISINNNDGRLTTYLNLQYGRRATYDSIKTDRWFAPDSVLGQEAFTHYSGNNYYFGYGFSYALNKKWELSYDGRLNYNSTENKTDNESRIRKTSTDQLIFSNLTTVQNRGWNYSISQGASLKYKIDSLGSEWSTDLSWTGSPNRTEQYFNTGDGVLHNRLGFYSAQSNLLWKPGKKITVETGLKSAGVQFRNQTDYYRISGNNRLKDESRSGAYKYREQIHSAYLQASKNFGGIIVKLGTRLENTRMNGNQLTPADTSFSVNRTDLFPYVYISRTIMTIAGYDLRAYLVFRRTINRPAYSYLNPSLRFIDPYLFETGNPGLRPQFTRNYEANISVDERPLFAVGINETEDIFTQVIYPSDSSNTVNYRTYDNLGRNKETYLRILGAIPPGRKYFFVAGAQYNHNFYTGQYENKPLTFKKGSWTIFTYHTLKVTPLTQLSLSGFARFKGQQQFYELSDFGELRMSVNQQFFKKKLNLTLSVNDMFRTNRNEFTINQGSIRASGMRSSDTRRFGINLRYNFGWRKKEESNPFDVESPEGRN